MRHRAPNFLAIGLLSVAVVVAQPGPAHAAALDGATLSWPWALPFGGILLTIALAPLLSRRLWHRHYGKIVLAWMALTLVPLAVLRGTDVALAALVRALIGDYLGFITVLFALYVVAGGILVTGALRGTPLTNAVTLAFGTLIASVVGTTGAAMILIRPLIRANAARRHNAHVVVFFIFLVCNIGGALSPLGDPPLYVGFLTGVDFFWPLQHLWQPVALAAGCTLIVFVIVDVWFAWSDRGVAEPIAAEEKGPLRVSGAVNLLLLLVIIGAVIVSALWSPGMLFAIYGTPLLLQDLVRDAVLLAAALASLWLTPGEHRKANGFSFGPIVEVALLFAGIFVCAMPVLTMLAAGSGGAFGWLLAAVTAADGAPRPLAYFWLTGMLSAILDNAPAYLAFFQLAGGKAANLMGPRSDTLAAISMGAVFMGALTYIGNAPNFMIYAIATERGIKMPSFFGYIAWAAAVLLPVFALVTRLLAWHW
jgi:Na+/H+ antiporter NhaD/arsenite permease-like protein